MITGEWCSLMTAWPFIPPPGPRGGPQPTARTCTARFVQPESSRRSRLIQGRLKRTYRVTPTKAVNPASVRGSGYTSWKMCRPSWDT